MDEIDADVGNDRDLDTHAELMEVGLEDEIDDPVHTTPPQEPFQPSFLQSLQSSNMTSRKHWPVNHVQLHW